MTKKMFFNLLLWSFSDLKYEIFKADSMCNAICDAMNNCCLVVKEVNSKADKENWAEMIIKCTFFCSNYRLFSDLKYTILKQIWSIMRFFLTINKEDLKANKKNKTKMIIKCAFFYLLFWVFFDLKYTLLI